MRKSRYQQLDLVPKLSKGKHRNPRKGACFMEMASFLAGERWSDHPRCTHPLLSGLARLVNDHTTDENRGKLLELIPSVIGLTTTDPRVDARIGWRCATTALPLIAAGSQNTMAVGVLIADRVLAELDGGGRTELLPESREALERVPLAFEWAMRYAGEQRVPPEGFRRTSAPSIVRTAVPAISVACIPDSDAVLRELLSGAIDDVREVCAAGAVKERRTAPETTPTPVG